MATQTRPKRAALGGTAISAIWIAYSNWTTASQLPHDASGLAKMLTDPPIYLPWLCLAGFVLAIWWAFGPQNRAEIEDLSTRPALSGAPAEVYKNHVGDTYHVVGAPGGNTIGRVDRLQVGQQMVDSVPDEVVRDLTAFVHEKGNPKVRVAGVGTRRSWQAACVLAAQLRSSGTQVDEEIEEIFEQWPGQDVPVYAEIQKDGSIQITVDLRIAVRMP